MLSGDSAEVKKGLSSASGFIRSELARRLNLRNTPKLTFIEDNVTERAIHISQVLKEIDEKRSQIEAEKPSEEESDE